MLHTYGKGQKSKAQQYSCIPDQRENPHVVMGDVSMKAWECGAMKQAMRNGPVPKVPYPTILKSHTLSDPRLLYFDLTLSVSTGKVFNTRS